MAPLCDLHTHSNRSDGTNTPGEILRLAEEAGLAAVALTDHNTVSGLPEFHEAAKSSHVEAVGGIEISVDHEGTELHMLGLFLRPAHYAPIEQILAESNRRKEESNLRLAEALCRGGYPVDYARLCRSTGGQVNRAHFAAALTEAGFTPSIQAAFRTILHEDAGFYEAPPRPDALQIVRFLRELGAAPVLAHPMIDLTVPALEDFLTRAVGQGLAAMETRYPLYTREQTRLAREMVQHHGICESGGSDFHGRNKPDIRLGTGRGNVEIPLHILNTLKEVLQR